MDNFIIRAAKQEEAGVIADFQRAMAWETENVKLDPETVENGVQAVFADPPKGKYYVAGHKGEIVACMLTTYEWSDWRNGNFIWLQSVYVKPEWRGKGVFRQMYEYIRLLVSENHGFKGIRLYVFHTNESAQEVYRSTGLENGHYKMFEWVKP